MIKKDSIIYGIEIDKTFVYIGKLFGRTKAQRKREHFHYLKHNKHHSRKLQLYYNRYGENNFVFKELHRITCSDDELYELEEVYIKKYKTHKTQKGCNVTSGGKGMKGVKQSESSIQQIRETKLKGFEEGIYIKTDGEINGMHVLREYEVKEIIELFYQKKYTHQQIADRYGVIRQTISLIHNGKRWSYLKDVQDWMDYKRENKLIKTIKKISKSDVYEIKYLIKYTQMKPKDIAEIYDINVETVRKIRKNKRHSDVNLEKPYDHYKGA
ncbi:hypothetical protein WKH57_01725 [Niallia taxi]|uniref:hypothetical protein n=1 Tax=Niallia taxi TaxID=2499688 RepID=UPI003177F037